MYVQWQGRFGRAVSRLVGVRGGPRARLYRVRVRRVPEEAAKTRTALIDSGLAVFAEQGYAASTLADISARAGLTRGAAYHHFGNKAELYTAALAERWAEVGGPVAVPLTRLEDRPRRRLHDFLVLLRVGMAEDPRFRQLLRVIGRNDALPDSAGLDVKHDALERLREQFAELFAEAESAGELRSGVRAKVAAEFVMSQVVGMVAVHGFGWGAAADGDSELVEVLLDGLFGRE